MSSVLAIETSTPLGSVAVLRDGVISFEKSFTSERSHNSQLFAPLREALDVVGGSLRAIVVGTGPASYTGVRIGIAAAQGIALSRNVPVIGLPSVLAVEVAACRADLQVCSSVASSFSAQADVEVCSTFSSSYCICGDARRGSFFVAEIRGEALFGDIVTLDEDGLRRRHVASHNRIPWFTFDPKPPFALQGVHCISPSASRLAAIAAKLPGEDLKRLAQAPLEPVYLSAPFVTMPAQH